MEYFILSISHSPWGNDCVWWGPNDAGYTSRIESAGRYTEKQVSENRSYYNNGRTTRAIPCDEAEAKAHRVVEWKGETGI